MLIKDLFDALNSKSSNSEDVFSQAKSLVFKGWVISKRGNEKICFIILNDGSTLNDLQVVLKNPSEQINKLRLATPIEVQGTIVLTPNNDLQPFELQAKTVKILKKLEQDFPIQKKETTLEKLREMPQLRHHTKIFRAIMRIRSTLALEIHNYFNQKNFLYMNSPILTSNDGEGGGETFEVLSRAMPNFFDKTPYLCVTGQLHAEAYALGFSKVYTFGPTFRAENSNTTRHMAEFWMIEPEVAFYDLKQIIHLAIDLLKQVIKNTIELLKPEFDYLNTLSHQKLLPKLKNFINQELKIIDYQEALAVLSKHKQNFKHQSLSFGTDLATEHERFLCEQVYKQPVAVINYPKDIKAFYMFQNQDNKTVAAFDLLVPGVGELIGGSQRETDYNKLLKRINELKLDVKDLQWYLDLRKFGDAQSSGFGIGFERLIMYVTGVENIRDTIPFPRTPGTLRM